MKTAFENFFAQRMSHNLDVLIAQSNVALILCDDAGIYHTYVHMSSLSRRLIRRHECTIHIRMQGHKW